MKCLFIIIIAILATACCEQNDKESTKEEKFHYSIDLNVAGLKGPVILLDRTTREPVQTVYSKSEKFELEGELPLDKMHATFVLHFPSKYSNPYFYPIKEACAVNFEMDSLTTIVAHYDSLLFAKIENVHMKDVESFKKKNFPAIIEFEQFNMQGLKSSNGERRSTEEQKAYAKRGNALLKAVSDEIISNAGSYADSEEMAVIIAEWGGQIGVEKLDSLAALLSPTVKETAAYKRIIAVSDYIKKQAAPLSLKVGGEAPNFSLPDEKGNIHSLSDFKGKYLVIDFWASWCGPCKKEMPFMRELYERYHSKGLEMLAISTDSDRSKWIKANQQLNMPYLQLHDEKGEASKSYYVKGIPFVLLINPEGVITAIKRGEELEGQIKKVLNITE